MGEMKEIVERFTGICLNYLVEKGFVEFDDITKNPTLYYDINLGIETIVWAIPHESIHLTQMCKGDLMQMPGYTIWKGVRYNPVTIDDLDYFKKQPWESEAQEIEKSVRKHLDTIIGSGRGQGRGQIGF